VLSAKPNQIHLFYGHILYISYTHTHTHTGFCCCWYFETGFHYVAQAVLKLTMRHRLPLNSWSSCLGHLNTDITSMNCHAQLQWIFLLSVIYCCIISHPKVSGLKQQLLYLTMDIWAWLSWAVCLLDLPEITCIARWSYAWHLVWLLARNLLNVVSYC
jgi:hypothetical protein